MPSASGGPSRGPYGAASSQRPADVTRGERGINAQNELAFRKRRLRDRGFDPAADPVVAQWRSQIGELRRILGR
jgi:hypothetical protein